MHGEGRVRFWAHSDRSGLAEDAPGSKWQPLAEHLENVGKLSRQLAALAAPEFRHFHDLAEWAGVLHDYGKYTPCFQEMIRRGKGKCPQEDRRSWDQIPNECE